MQLLTRSNATPNVGDFCGSKGSSNETFSDGPNSNCSKSQTCRAVKYA